MPAMFFSRETLLSMVYCGYAKDDPMAKFESAQKFIARTNAQTAIFQTGGHLISGHGDAVSIAIIKFIEETK